jgi:hypothetical protein
MLSLLQYRMWRPRKPFGFGGGEVGHVTVWPTRVGAYGLRNSDLVGAVSPSRDDEVRAVSPPVVCPRLSDVEKWSELAASINVLALGTGVHVDRIGSSESEHVSSFSPLGRELLP